MFFKYILAISDYYPDPNLGILLNNSIFTNFNLQSRYIITKIYNDNIEKNNNYHIIKYSFIKRQLINIINKFSIKWVIINSDLDIMCIMDLINIIKKNNVNVHILLSLNNINSYDYDIVEFINNNKININMLVINNYMSHSCIQNNYSYYYIDNFFVYCYNLEKLSYKYYLLTHKKYYMFNSNIVKNINDKQLFNNMLSTSLLVFLFKGYTVFKACLKGKQYFENMIINLLKKNNYEFYDQL